MKKALSHMPIHMLFTFKQVSITNPLQLESTNFSFMLVTTEFAVGCDKQGD